MSLSRRALMAVSCSRGHRVKTRSMECLDCGWRIPNRDGLDNSLKIARRGHTTEDANVTVAEGADNRSVLIVGSGYGYLGCDPRSMDSRALEAMRQGVVDTIDTFFPGSSSPAENNDVKCCVRPWTATSLGLHHVEAMETGQLLIINGGHNTGGFTQAPAIAAAVSANLRGELHPMNRLYTPGRFSAFARCDD